MKQLKLTTVRLTLIIVLALAGPLAAAPPRMYTKVWASRRLVTAAKRMPLTTLARWRGSGRRLIPSPYMIVPFLRTPASPWTTWAP
jgi:hypothetical protein